MAELRNESVLLVITVIGAGLALVVSPLSFGLPATMGGVTLLLILYSYDHGSRRTVGQSVAFGAVSACAFTLAAGIGIQRLAERRDMEMWMALTWLGAAVAATAIDRARMGARPAQMAASAGAVMPGTPVAVPGRGVEAAPQPAFVPAAAPERRASATKYGLGLSGSAPAQPYRAVEETIPAGETTYTEPPAAAPMPLAAQPMFMAAPEAEPEPASAFLSPQAEPAGDSTIYINVIDQGIALLRSVRAQHIARDIYQIVDTVPEREVWRYQPGQTVRCRKQKLSSGKALVAYEEVVLQRTN